MNIDLKFKPKEYVKISCYDLHCEGRVVRCILEYPDQQIYDIDFWINGEPRRREFYADELEKIK